MSLLDLSGERASLRQAVNAFILDLNGILFAVQLVCLLVIGPYADYGHWRPGLLICERIRVPSDTRLIREVFTVILWGMTLGVTGLTGPNQWQAANALFVLGNLALNVSNTFYWAAFRMKIPFISWQCS